MEPAKGLEPATCWLQISCSTNWAMPAYNDLSILSYFFELVNTFLNNFFKSQGANQSLIKYSARLSPRAFGKKSNNRFWLIVLHFYRLRHTATLYFRLYAGCTCIRRFSRRNGFPRSLLRMCTVCVRVVYVPKSRLSNLTRSRRF